MGRPTVNVHEAAVEIVRLAVDELQPVGREYSDVTRPAWLVAALGSPELARAIEVEVHGLTKEARRIAIEVTREADRARPLAASLASMEQLGLFGGGR